jgi:hypothetical protein
MMSGSLPLIYSGEWRYRWAIGLFISVAAGVIYRLIWLQDMEYKGDEAWTFTQVQAFWQTHHLLSIGIPSSVGLPIGGKAAGIADMKRTVLFGRTPATKN